MNSDPPVEQSDDEADEMLAEYDFDYTRARPNRFQASHLLGGRMIVLEPDVAQVFTTAESVNAVLRALMTTMPPLASR